MTAAAMKRHVAQLRALSADLGKAIDALERMIEPLRDATVGDDRDRCLTPPPPLPHSPTRHP